MKKKIALLSYLYKPNIGGVENSIYELSKSFVKFGYDVNIYCTTEPKNLKLSENEILDKIPVNRYRWKHGLFLRFPLNILYNLFNLGNWIGKKVPISKYISRHHYMCVALFLAGKRDYIYIVPEVIKKNEKYRLSLSWDRKALMMFNHRIQKFAIQKSKKTFVFSRNVQEQLKAAGINYLTHIVNPGLQLERFAVEKDICRERLGFSANFKYLLGLSRMIEGKGYQYAIEAVSIMQDKGIKVVLVGDGPYKISLVALAKSLGISDQILFFDKTDLPELFYRACDCFLMTSLNEAFGQTILEAAAADLPIISFEKGVFENIVVETATEEILGNRDGVYYCKPDVNSLSSSIAKAKEDLDKGTINICYQDIKDKYSWDKLALELIR